MTSLVNKATQNIIDTHGFEHLSASVGVIVIVLLIVLLIEREVLRAFGGPRAVARVRSLTAASLPLLLVAIAIIVTRVQDLVHS
jgi:hypothetical protein